MTYHRFPRVLEAAELQGKLQRNRRGITEELQRFHESDSFRRPPKLDQLRPRRGAFSQTWLQGEFGRLVVGSLIALSRTRATT